MRVSLTLAAAAATVLVVGLTLALAAPSPAAAYGNPLRFDAPVESGGGAGRRFTGSPTDGHTCGVCHGEDEVPLPVVGLPDLGYVPGAAYVLTMDLGTGAGTAAGSLEVTDAYGAALGTLEAIADEELADDERCASDGMATEGATEVYPVGDDRMVASTKACGARISRALWTSPTEGTEPAYVYGASVRGNSDGTTTGDRVGLFSASVPVEGAPPPERVLDGGCAVAGPAMATPGKQRGGGPTLGLVVAALTLSRRRRRQGRYSRPRVP